MEQEKLPEKEKNVLIAPEDISWLDTWIVIIAEDAIWLLD